MPADDYTSVPSTGKLKLKGVTDGRIDKKKKKKKSKKETEAEPEAIAEASEHSNSKTEETQDTETFIDRSVVLKTLENEDAVIHQQNQKTTIPKPAPLADNTHNTIDPKTDVEEMNKHLKTASELRFEEQRRKRLEERLKREGVKTHKQRVEELNRYLSGLSEHHDMPKIGPG